MPRAFEDRFYQRRTVEAAFAHWNHGARSLLVVAPPGAGKTEIAILTIKAFPTDGRVLWVVHTRRLAEQAAKRLAHAFGESVSVIMDGCQEIPGARLVVGVVHSLLGHEPFNGFDLVVLDEAHHYLADVWGGVRELFKGKRPKELGLTATPERDDGRPLGDIFEHLVVAASYSELRAGGWIVKARVVRPKRYLRSNFAQHPVDAWAKWSEGSRTIGFYPFCETADMYNDEFLARNVEACRMHTGMPEVEQAKAWDDFEEGKCKVLSTVAGAIEGLDVPGIGCLILARSFHFIGGYLQATGRGLRVDPKSGKKYVIVIDLTGTTVRHLYPDIDREYSLTGRAISGTGSPGHGGGERALPSVLGLEMRQSDEDEAISPIQLPDPDPKIPARKKAIEAEFRKLRTRYGANVAEQLMQMRGL